MGELVVIMVYVRDEIYTVDGMEGNGTVVENDLVVVADFIKLVTHHVRGKTSVGKRCGVRRKENDR